MRKLLAIILMVLFAGCATAGPEPHKHAAFTKHYEDSRFEVTKKGMFSVEMVVKDHELRTGMNMLDLIIHDRNDRDVIGAEITVTPWMPEMGHGVFEAPVVTERGGGLYGVEDIVLTMKGHWELRVVVQHDAMEDAAVFDFPDVKMAMGHEHMAMKVPSDLDLATEKMTDNKIFIVSYESNRKPVPINTIHSWKMRVNTADGRPVTGANISLDGDMPQHGHGLPTQPEVTQETRDGNYLVEGIKFSMPGWWVMKFNIRSGDKEDTVTFNLLLKE